MTKKYKRDWKLPAFDQLCPSPIEWAQMAAFIDGEGSILINTQKHKSTVATGFYLRVTIANTDVRLPVWLKEHFGGTYSDSNTEKYYEGKNWKRAYHWGASSHRAAWILHHCMPYFVMKADQAQLGISLQESLSQYPSGGNAHDKYLKEDVREVRRDLKRRLLIMKARGKTMMEDQQKRIEEVS